MEDACQRGYGDVYAFWVLQEEEAGDYFYQQLLKRREDVAEVDQKALPLRSTRAALPGARPVWRGSMRELRPDCGDAGGCGEEGLHARA